MPRTVLNAIGNMEIPIPLAITECEFIIHQFNSRLERSKARFSQHLEKEHQKELEEIISEWQERLKELETLQEEE